MALSEVAPVDDKQNDASQWPAVERAYDFVLPSYQMLGARFEAADTRLTTILNFSATITLGAPLLAKSIDPNIAFKSPFFITAVIVFVVSTAIGIIGRINGSIVLPDPMVFWKSGRLRKSEWQFRKDAIFFAGQHFDRNAQTIRIKGNVAHWMAGLLAVEVLWLIAWLAS